LSRLGELDSPGISELITHGGSECSDSSANDTRPALVPRVRRESQFSKRVKSYQTLEYEPPVSSLHIRFNLEVLQPGNQRLHDTLTRVQAAAHRTNRIRLCWHRPSIPPIIACENAAHVGELELWEMIALSKSGDELAVFRLARDLLS
jgi:hypothetical protein